MIAFARLHPFLHCESVSSVEACIGITDLLVKLCGGGEGEREEGGNKGIG